MRTQDGSEGVGEVERPVLDVQPERVLVYFQDARRPPRAGEFQGVPLKGTGLDLQGGGDRLSVLRGAGGLEDVVRERLSAALLFQRGGFPPLAGPGVPAASFEDPQDVVA